MKPIAPLAIICALSLSSVGAQSLYLSIGGGFSTQKPPDNYSFNYVDAQLWPGTFETLDGRHADVGFSISSSFLLQLSGQPISITTGFQYAQIYGTTDYTKAHPPPWYSTIYIIGDLTTRSNILTFKTGVQYEFLESPVMPYAGLSLLCNIIGDTRLTISNGGTTTKALIDGNTRAGASLDAGVRLPLHRSIQISVGGDYSWINLLTPESDEQTRGIFNLGLTIHYRLL
jgi:hypothetical protein